MKLEIALVTPLDRSESVFVDWTSASLTAGELIDFCSVVFNKHSHGLL